MTMDDEVARSKAKTAPPRGFEESRRRPVSLLFGLAVGLGLAWIPAFLSPYFAPLPALIVGGVLTLFPIVRAIGLGSIAAACGIAVFLATGLLLIVIF
jgi:hypothetical protein